MTKLRAEQDICHVEYRVVDSQGVRVPDAAHEVTFRIEGPARIIGIDNGDLNSPETGKDGVRQSISRSWPGDCADYFAKRAKFGWSRALRGCSRHRWKLRRLLDAGGQCTAC